MRGFSKSQDLQKYYWYGFGGILVVLALIFLAMSIFGASDDEESGDIPELPEDEVEIPNIEEKASSEVVGDAAQPRITENASSGGSVASNSPAEFVGTWRVYSERLFYDQGGGGSTLSASSGTSTTQKLELKKNGEWTFGSSSGTYIVAGVGEGDWKSWGIEAYGPTRKITLEGWNKGTASGPVEESGNVVSFIWVLYRVGPPTVSKPGMAHMKFGH